MAQNVLRVGVKVNLRDLGAQAPPHPQEYTHGGLATPKLDESPRPSLELEVSVGVGTPAGDTARQGGTRVAAVAGQLQGDLLQLARLRAGAQPCRLVLHAVRGAEQALEFAQADVGHALNSITPWARSA